MNLCNNGGFIIHKIMNVKIIKECNYGSIFFIILLKNFFVSKLQCVFVDASMDQSNFMMKFLQRNTLKRKRKEDEFYEDFELFFPKPSNEEEETEE